MERAEPTVISTWTWIAPAVARNRERQTRGQQPENHYRIMLSVNAKTTAAIIKVFLSVFARYIPWRALIAKAYNTRKKDNGVGET